MRREHIFLASDCLVDDLRHPEGVEQQDQMRSRIERVNEQNYASDQCGVELRI